MNAALLLSAVLLLGADSQPPPEMKVLEKMVGTWISKATPAETRGQDTSKNELILGGRFIQSKVYSSQGELTQIHIFTYDSKEKVYRHWYFAADGSTLDSTGAWNADTRTLTFTKKQVGSTGILSFHFVDDNTVQWTVVWRDAVGTVTFSAEGTSTRQK